MPPHSQILGEAAGGGIAECGIFLHALRDDARELGIDPGERRRFGVCDVVQHVDHVRRVEGAAAGGGFVEDAAEGENVGARVGLLAADLFGRHVRRGSGYDSGVGEERLGQRVGLRLRTLEQFREAEVDDLRVAVAVDHDVLGLEIAVDDPALVRLRDRFRDLRQRLEQLRQTRAVVDARAQRRAVDELHRDVRNSLVVNLRLIDRVDVDDVRMIERRSRARLLAKALQAVGIDGEAPRQDLDRDAAVQPLVDGGVHRAHPARADLLGNRVVSQPRAGGNHPAQIRAISRSSGGSTSRVTFPIRQIWIQFRSRR